MTLQQSNTIFKIFSLNLYLHIENLTFFFGIAKNCLAILVNSEQLPNKGKSTSNKAHRTWNVSTKDHECTTRKNDKKSLTEPIKSAIK